MLAVLVLLVITRMLDSFAWTPSAQFKHKAVFFDHLFQFFSFLPFLPLFIYTYNWLIKTNNRLLLYGVIVLNCLIGPVLFLLLSTWVETIFLSGQVAPFTLDLIKRYSPGVSMVLLFLTATYFLTHLVLQGAKQKEIAYKAETLAKDVQLRMLRYQINPHFLFNVLNSIYTLIDENTDKAKKLVIDMSEYYRYTLNKQQYKIQVEKEVESILKYLEIQKTRFEEEFQYEINVDEMARSVQIPSFIIHLLIENAVKYGTKTEKKKLIINVSIRLSGSSLFIKVSNTGKLLIPANAAETNNNGTNNGIENLKYRLALYYNEKYTFSLKEEDGWVIADIEINDLNT